MSRPEAMAQAFIAAAHRMTAEHIETKATQQNEIAALLTMLEQTTQSRSIAERCAAAKRVLG